MQLLRLPSRCTRLARLAPSTDAHLPGQTRGPDSHCSYRACGSRSSADWRLAAGRFARTRRLVVRVCVPSGRCVAVPTRSVRPEDAPCRIYGQSASARAILPRSTCRTPCLTSARGARARGRIAHGPLPFGDASLNRPDFGPTSGAFLATGRARGAVDRATSC